MGEVPTVGVVAIADQTTTAEVVTTGGIVPAIVTVAEEEEATAIRGRPVTIAIGILDRITAREVGVVISATIPTRIREIAVLPTARDLVPNILLREVAEIMVVAAEAEIITAEIVVVVAVALPVGTTMVAAHPTINVAMIIILRRLVAVAAAVQTVIGWTIAAAAGDAATDPANRWDRRDRLFRGATTTGDRRFERRWVRAGRHRCRRCAGVPQEVGLRVVSGTMDAAG